MVEIGLLFVEDEGEGRCFCMQQDKRKKTRPKSRVYTEKEVSHRRSGTLTGLKRVDKCKKKCRRLIYIGWQGINRDGEDVQQVRG